MRIGVDFARHVRWRDNLQVSRIALTKQPPLSRDPERSIGIARQVGDLRARGVDRTHITALPRSV